jgi:RHS repeat-associated protein
VYSPSTLELEYEIQGDVKIDRFIDAWGRSTGYSLSFSGEQPIASVSYSYDVNNHFESVDSDQFMVANHCTYAYLPGTDLVQSMTKDSGLSWGRYYEDKRDLIYAVSNRFNDTLISFSEFVNDPIGRQIGGSNYTVNRGPTKPNYFGYNIFSEITNAVTGVGTVGYSYDPIGNRNWEVKGAEATEYLANGINQYTNIVDRIATAPTYDLDGNILRDRQFAYRWDAENRLVGLSNLVSSESSEYHYDSRSRRISKTVVDPSSSTLQSVYFVYDGWNLVCELKCCPNTVFTNLYVWGLDVSGSLQGAGGVGGLLSATVSNETYNPAYVNKFNVSEMVRSDGTVVAHYEYDPFGNTTLVDGNMSAVFPFRYSTKYTDPESGFPYYGYRYLSPSLSRWLNRDPVDEQGGVMVYGFVKNNPVNLVDKYGLYAVEKAYFNDLPQATGFTQAILQPNKELELNFDKNSCTCSVKQPEEFKLYLDKGVSI